MYSRTRSEQAPLHSSRNATIGYRIGRLAIDGLRSFNHAARGRGVANKDSQPLFFALTPELSVCGYTFADRIGTDWIEPQPDSWTMQMCRLAARLKATVFLSHPERDRRTNTLHNSLFVIAPDGAIAGRHRKINALRVGSEWWSTAGAAATTVAASPLECVGLLICADAFSPGIAGSLCRQGTELLVSSAAWAPGFHDPNGEWEQCTKDTGLSFLVCNRTGPDLTLDFSKAESVVVKDGRRLLSMSAAHSTIFVIEWDLRLQDLAARSYQRIEL